ncbi:hypothetical protein [Segetibacter aerophilus]|nr:hypothetical protein [Segetibacter aerophilus]
MDESRRGSIIKTLQRRWNQQSLVAYLILSFAVTCVASTIVIELFDAPFFIVPVVLITVLVLLFFGVVRKFTEQDVALFLNRAFPEFEESSHLLLKPYDSLNLLERLQVSKVESRMVATYPTPAVVKRKLKTAFILLTAGVLLSVGLLTLPAESFQKISKAGLVGNSINPGKRETKPAEVTDAKVIIDPPAYTGKSTREQDRFNVVAEQDAMITWNIATTTRVKEVQLIFNDKVVLHLQPVDKGFTKWSGRRQVKSAGFYQVKIANSLSELYQVEMIKDQPPVIIVQAPQPNTVIEYGQPQKVLINVALTDDYGIENTFINATTASGSGEAVKFKEQQIPFANFSAGNKQYQLQKQVDLAALGMQPGDELYFYVNARDNYRQEKRSDVYIVRMEDTTQLMSMEGLVNGVDLKPEFFRSQRQIIIETEQLLKDRDTISVESFNKKSSDLGVDQKLLRLRYGKFLGEENETEIGGDHEHDEAGNTDGANAGNADKILDQYSHKHDNAEDATFFDAKTKKQLLATLSEMWKAELQLRTLKPKAALPFEYKALRLLKNLQQQTRAYVGKTGSKTTPLKPEIRLTGDLAKVEQPVVEQQFEQKADPVTTLRKALGILELARSKETLQRTSIEILEQASMLLSTKAASEPSNYLASLEALKRILKKNYKASDVNLAGSAFQKMIRSVSAIPQQSKASPDMKLSQRYFLNLKRQND